MRCWAIADLHLSFGPQHKPMDPFGKEWIDHPAKIAQFWKENVHENDLVFIPGDISWAMHFKDAMIDLTWIDRLPGKKILCRGNHDYWWPSQKKLTESLPPSLFAIHNNAFRFGSIAVGGTRLWDTTEYSYQSLIDFQPNVLIQSREKDPEKEEKIFVRELHRLARSIEQMDLSAPFKVILVHYPPIGPEGLPSRASQMLDKANIDLCLFGHLHSIRRECRLDFTHNATRYLCVSADYIDFQLRCVIPEVPADTRHSSY